MYLSEVPKTTHFSISQEKEESKDSEGTPMRRDNLLQVTVRDRTILYDLAPENPQELFFLNASSQFIAAGKYVEAGVKIVRCQEDPSPEKDGYLID